MIRSGSGGLSSASELFPYASRRYSALPNLIPSQRYSSALAAAKIRSGCPVIVMRAETPWRESLPELAQAECYRLKNPQAVYVSRNNLPPEAVRRIEGALRAL